MKTKVFAPGIIAMILFVVFNVLTQSISAANECELNFDRFILQFERDQSFQLENIEYPLAFLSVDVGAVPEPVVVKKELSKLDISKREKPLYPSVVTQQEHGLIKTSILNTNAIKKIRLSKPDTDYIVDYSFELIKGCWKLSFYEDHSL